MNAILETVWWLSLLPWQSDGPLSPAQDPWRTVLVQSSLGTNKADIYLRELFRLFLGRKSWIVAWLWWLQEPRAVMGHGKDCLRGGITVQFCSKRESSVYAVLRSSASLLSFICCAQGTFLIGVFKDQLLASLLIFKDRHLKKKLSLPFGFAYSFPWLHSF